MITHLFPLFTEQMGTLKRGFQCVCPELWSREFSLLPHPVFPAPIFQEPADNIDTEHKQGKGIC